METQHYASEQQFASIEAQITRLGMQLQVPIVQFPQLYRKQHQVVLLLERGSAAAGPLPPPVHPT